MITKLNVWGNSQGLRITRDMMREMDVTLEDDIDIEFEGRIMLVRKAHHRKSLEERVAAYGGKLGPYTEYDWGEAAGRERWADED